MLWHGWIFFLFASAVTAYVACAKGKRGEGKLSERTHRWICLAVFALGCAVRLIRLSALPEGMSAEEALLGVQAKALWQTGGFLFGEGLTTQLSMWSGESSGPLLMALTAPFVGLGKMNALMTRLPLVLLSIAAMPAAYGLGQEIGGKSAGRWCLVLYALCPYFILNARLTMAANAAVFMFPIALCFMVKGLRRPCAFYAGILLLALTAYAQDLFFFIAPVGIVIAALIALRCSDHKRHVLCAMVLGLMLCVPALLTLWVNMTEAEGFRLFGLVTIPKLEDYPRIRGLLSKLDGKNNVNLFWNQLRAVLIGGIFQFVRHENIASELVAPDGLLVFYVVSLPLIALALLQGVVSIFSKRGAKGGRGGVWTMLMGIGTWTLAVNVLFGSAGVNDLSGCTYELDYSSMFVFTALMITQGLMLLERRSGVGASVMGTLFLAEFVVLCVFLFGGDYQESANVYFSDFDRLVVYARDIQAEKGGEIYVSDSFYPHKDPGAATEMLFLYASDIDTEQAERERETSYHVIYADGTGELDPEGLYIVRNDECGQWDTDAFGDESCGRYILLYPMGWDESVDWSPSDESPLELGAP